MDNNSPLVMGIINITDNSFYAPSRALEPNEICKRFEKMIEEGADVIDLGACSTKPGSIPVSPADEERRIIMAVKALNDSKLCARLGAVLSIDTFRSSVVRKVYDLIGEFMVNDISAGEDDPLMLKTVGELGLPYVAMHKRGTPSSMQSLVEYPQGVVNEVVNYFKKFAEKASAFNIREWILDPGFGFAKTIEQNYELLQGLEKFKGLGRPILVGLSRKSMIYRLLDITPEESLPYTVALNLYALCHGAAILRVHDIPEAVRCVKIWRKMYSTGLCSRY